MTPVSPAKPFFHLAETLLVAFVGGWLFDFARFPVGWMAGAMVAVAAAALAGRPMHMPTLLARGFFHRARNHGGRHRHPGNCAWDGDLAA